MKPGLAAFAPKQVKNIGLREKTVLSLSYGRIVIKPEEKLHGLVPESFETYQIVDPGDIIIRGTDLQNDKQSLRIGLSRYRGIITSAYICLKPRPPISSEYAYQILNVYDLTKALYAYGSGLRQNLDKSDLKRMPVFLPPRVEQDAIVSYLKVENQRINRFIRNRRRLINVLSEQKQAIINQAVTRGLDPGVPLKSSGIDWIGDIPEHWEMEKLRFIADSQGGMTPSKAEETFWNGSIPWVTPKDMKRAEIDNSIDHITNNALKRTNIKLIKPPVVLIVVRGMILARTVPVAVTTRPVTINQDMKALTLRPCVDATYMRNLLVGIANGIRPLVEESGHGTRVLRTDLWRNMLLPLPPIAEQKLINYAIALDTANVEVAMSKAQVEIDLIREYRTRLISDVVTGKVDVRHLAPPPGSEDLGERAEALEPLEEDVAADMMDDEEPVNEAD